MSRLVRVAVGVLVVLFVFFAVVGEWWGAVLVAGFLLLVGSAVATGEVPW